MKPDRAREKRSTENASEDAEWQPRRRQARRRLFRPAHVVVDDTVLECVLVDISLDGAQVCLVAWANLPERVTLLLPGGGSRPMRRCWQQGSFIGFEALGDPVRVS